MDQLEQNQATFREEVSKGRAQMGQLMETIQAVARGQEIMSKMQEEMNHRGHALNYIPNANPFVMKKLVPSQGNVPFHIPVGAPDGVPLSILNPHVIEVDDHHDAFFSLLANKFRPHQREKSKQERCSRSGSTIRRDQSQVEVKSIEGTILSKSK